MDTKNVAKIFIVKEGCVLLLYTTRLQKWHLPGGHIMRNETYTEGLRREVLEETGQELDEFYLMRTKPYTRLYVGTLRANNIQLSKEHIEYKWVKISDLLNEVLCKFTHSDAKYLQLLFNNLKFTNN